MAKAPKVLAPPPQATVGLQTDINEVIPVYFANCFNVAKDDVYFRVNLGCQLGGTLVHSAILVLPVETVLYNKKETIDYFNSNGDVEPGEQTQFLMDKPQVFYGKLLSLARNSKLGELNPVFFRLSALYQGSKTVHSSSTVSINTPIAVQLGIVKCIYIDE